MLDCQHGHALLFEFKTYRITAMKRARTKKTPLGAWSKEELRLLKKLYPSNTAKQIGELIGRSVWSVRKKVEVLGLSKRFRYEDSHRVVKGTKEKRCRKCRKWRRESQFFGDRSNKDGLKIYCKTCDTEAQREYRHKRVKEVREYLRFEERHQSVRGIKQKLCNCCKQWKVETSFHKCSHARDGLALSCKECANERASERRGAGRDARKNRPYEDSHRVVKGVTQKLCTQCRKWKKENGFHKNRTSRDGLSSRCKECSKTTARERYRPNGKRLGRYFRYEERHRTVNGVKEKFCRKCRKWKKESDFYNCRSAKDGLDNWCKKCAYKPASKSHKK
jgi:hypothetical protein